MPRKLKVFQAQFGFYDSVVAAPSRPAALRVWGVHQNLFEAGGAHEATEPKAIEAALAHPETPLRRAAGSQDPFGLDPGLPDVPDGPAPKHKAKSGSHRPAQRPKRTQPDRKDLDAAEAAVERLKAERLRETRELAKRRKTLDDEENQARRRFEEAQSDVERKLERARGDYVKAGGRI